jgi:hypothetical protein
MAVMHAILAVFHRSLTVLPAFVCLNFALDFMPRAQVNQSPGTPTDVPGYISMPGDFTDDAGPMESQVAGPDRSNQVQEYPATTGLG